MSEAKKMHQNMLHYVKINSSIIFKFLKFFFNPMADDILLILDNSLLTQ